MTHLIVKAVGVAVCRKTLHKAQVDHAKTKFIEMNEYKFEVAADEDDATIIYRIFPNVGETSYKPGDYECMGPNQFVEWFHVKGQIAVNSDASES